MAIADALLDTSWSLHFVPATRTRLVTLRTLVKKAQQPQRVDETLHRLSDKLQQYLQTRRGAEPTDDLNDQNEETGKFSSCAISVIQPLSRSSNATTGSSLQLLIESEYQKTTYQVVLLIAYEPSRNDCVVEAILAKGSQSYIKHVKAWLGEEFLIPWPEQLQLPSDRILQMLSEYLHKLSPTWSNTTVSTDALRQATLKQVIGNLKMTLSFTAATNPEIASKLKSIDFDVPAETVNTLLQKAQHNTDKSFLTELVQAVYEKIGLRLPLSPGTPTEDSSTAQEIAEPPLMVTKISCAAFAVSVEGKLKLASKPIENAAVTGYDEQSVRAAHVALLDLVRAEGRRRGQTQALA